MANEIEVPVIFIEDTASGKKVFRRATVAGKKSGKAFSKGFSKETRDNIGGVFSSLKGKFLGLAASFGAIFATKAAIGAAARVEQIQTRLATLTGSAATAATVLGELREFAAETPFKLTDIAEASTKLLAFGKSTSVLKDTIKEIGEVAAGSGAAIGELALIYGQVGAAGKLTGERLLQLQERAIPIGPAIAKTMGVAEVSIRKLVSEGKVTQKIFEEAFRSMSQDGGKFEGALKKQSETVNGVLSTLSDNLFDLGVSFGDTFKPAVISGAKELIKLFQAFGKVVIDNGPTITKTLSSIADVLIVTPSKFWADFFSGNTSTSLSRVNEELTRVNEQIRLTKMELERAGNAPGFVKAFNDFTGGTQGAKDRLNELTKQMLELETAKTKLAGTPTATAEELALLEEQNRISRQLAESEKARATAKEALGIIGLSQEEVLLAQLEKQRQIIQTANETGAITEMEANERLLQIEMSFQKRMDGIRKKGAKDTLKTQKSIASSLRSSLVSTTASTFSAFGQLLAGGADAGKKFGSTIVGIMGDLAISIGTTIIGSAKAMEALKASLFGPIGTGAAAIVLGGALVAIGAAMKAASGSSGGSISAGGGQGSVGGTDIAGEEPEILTAQTEEREAETGVNINIAGDFLDSDEGGLKIVDAVNRAFETQGVQIRTNVA